MPLLPPPELQDHAMVFGDLTWGRLGEVLASHAGGSTNRLTVRHLLAMAQSQAHRWSEDELCIEIVSIVAIALQRPSKTCQPPFAMFGDEPCKGELTMT